MRKFILFVLLLCSTVSLHAQQMSDQQVIKRATELRKTGVSETDIAKQLIKQGATVDQLKRLRSQYSKQMEDASQTTSPEGMIGKSTRMRANKEKKDQKYKDYNISFKDSLSLDSLYQDPEKGVWP